MRWDHHQMDITIIIIGIQIIQFILTIWIKSRLENSIRHEYDKQLEDYKEMYFKREQSSKISALLATWISKPENETPKDKALRFKKLNQLSFELALWIPDEILLKELMKRLSNDPEAQGIKDILLYCRELIQDKKNKDIKAGDLVHFS